MRRHYLGEPSLNAEEKRAWDSWAGAELCFKRPDLERIISKTLGEDATVTTKNIISTMYSIGIKPGTFLAKKTHSQGYSSIITIRFENPEDIAFLKMSIL
jgi:hypothetical protein